MPSPSSKNTKISFVPKRKLLYALRIIQEMFFEDSKRRKSLSS